MGPFAVYADVEVRFRDTDAMGHVNNAVYLTYLEVGRQVYWQRLAASPCYRDVPFVVAHATIDFRSTVTVGEVVRVQLCTTWIGRSSFGMEYELRERESARLVATASTVQVTYDYAARHSIPVPGELRRDLETAEGRSLPARPDKL